MLLFRTDEGNIASCSNKRDFVTSCDETKVSLLHIQSLSMPNNDLVSETFPPAVQVIAFYKHLNYDDLLTASPYYQVNYFYIGFPLMFCEQND